MLILTSDSYIESDRKSCEIFRTVGISHINDLIEFEPHTFDDLQCILFCNSFFFYVIFIVRDQVAVQTTR